MTRQKQTPSQAPKYSYSTGSLDMKGLNMPKRAAEVRDALKKLSQDIETFSGQRQGKGLVSPLPCQSLASWDGKLIPDMSSYKAVGLASDEIEPQLALSFLQG